MNRLGIFLLCLHLVKTTTVNKEEKERNARIEKCKTKASTECDGAPIQIYQDLWKYKVERCLSQGGFRTDQECYEQEFTQSAQVCYQNECFNVEFSFKECITY